MTRILHLSDPHFGAMEPAAAEAFLTLAHALKPDLTILSGDLTMRARRRELVDAREFVEQLPRPHLVIPGNHDIPAINRGMERFFAPFNRFQKTFGDELEPELVAAGIHVVGLNSARGFGWYADWSEGRLSSVQLRGIVTKFNAGPPDHLRVLVLHHPLLELQIAGRAVVKPLQPLMEAIETARVDLVMCGHFHRSQLHAAGITADWKAIISQAPTVCSTRLQGEPQGFHEFRVSPGRIDAVHHVFRNGGFFAAGSFAYRCGAQGWADAPLTS